MQARSRLDRRSYRCDRWRDTALAQPIPYALHGFGKLRKMDLVQPVFCSYVGHE
jgi:hypothetical protein